jgi:hypothetical protein
LWLLLLWLLLLLLLLLFVNTPMCQSQRKNARRKSRDTNVQEKQRRGTYP